ncbi:HAD family hydrolase [Paraferrimonas haliotis]|uniref:Haloacid dehalogenase n=1 Tax=Paraferrimonas haliotis TaxID=2013866 RepID=A0AA37TNG8_9GAMM|nr:HAD-IA family hydrolase [Paraferrimonas haliotis]GLS82650.1 haloacid dehalogenase [Paraferrimonas haliotis]
MSQAILFDMDGTLVDTAVDIVDALNLALQQHGFPQANFDDVHQYTSDGSRGLINAAVGALDEQRFTQVQQSLFQHYLSTNGRSAQLYPGIARLLEICDSKGIAYGVITNKPARFSRPLLQQLNLDKRCATIISGDTCLKAKPSSMPMRLAANQTQVDCKNTWYLGDARRDIEAALAVGMHPVAVSWGYIKAEDPIASWPQHTVIDSPLDMLDLIK